MNKSRRHHYIPKFFIKNFTDDDGLLYIYNKEKDSILKNRQSPKGIFFEMDRNTVDFSGQKLDQLEKVYSELDSELAKDYLNALERKIVTPEELVSITLLANLLKWRVPNRDLEFDEIKNDLSQKELSIKIQGKNKIDKIDPKAIKHLENSEIFIETKRILISLLPLLTENKLLKIHNHSFFQINPAFPCLIGDDPIIMESSDFKKIGNFIFPMSSAITFIYKEGSIKRNIKKGGGFCFERDLAILNNSSKYIGCKDRTHLENIIAIYKQIKKDRKIENIDKHIFNYIE